MKRVYAFVLAACVFVGSVGFLFGYYVNMYVYSYQTGTPSVYTPIKGTDVALTDKSIPVAGSEPNPSESRINENQLSLVEGEEEQPAVDSLPDQTLLVFNYNYLVCGHNTTQDIYLPTELRGSTINDIENFYSDWTISSFGDNTITLDIEMEKKCPNHFVLKQHEGKIGVYYQPLTILGDVLKQVIEKDINELRQQDRDALENGIEIDSTQELLLAIEDFAS